LEYSYRNGVAIVEFIHFPEDRKFTFFPYIRMACPLFLVIGDVITL
jgi:hypothetical protein